MTSSEVHDSFQGGEPSADQPPPSAPDAPPPIYQQVPTQPLAPPAAYQAVVLQATYEPGLGQFSRLPDELRGWNWPAFFLTWIWGIFNGAMVTLWGLLLAVVPFGSLIWCIVCGAKGNEWAWRGKRWDSVEHFRSSQRKWLVAGLIVFIIFVILNIVVWGAIISAAGSADTYSGY